MRTSYLHRPMAGWKNNFAPFCQVPLALSAPSVRRPPPRLPLSGSDTRKQMITNRTPPPTPSLCIHAHRSQTDV